MMTPNILWIDVTDPSDLPMGVNILVMSDGECMANVYQDDTGFWLETFGGLKIEYIEPITHYALI